MSFAYSSMQQKESRNISIICEYSVIYLKPEDASKAERYDKSEGQQCRPTYEYTVACEKKLKDA